MHSVWLLLLNPWLPRVILVCSARRQDPVHCALYRGPCELGCRMKAGAGPPVPPPQPAGLLGTGVGAVPMRSWVGASCGDVPSLPPAVISARSLRFLLSLTVKVQC